MYYYTYTPLRDAKIIYKKDKTLTQTVNKNPNIHNKHIKLKARASMIIKHSFKSDDSKTCGSSS